MSPKLIAHPSKHKCFGYLFDFDVCASLANITLFLTATNFDCAVILVRTPLPRRIWSNRVSSYYSYSVAFCLVYISDDMYVACEYFPENEPDVTRTLEEFEDVRDPGSWICQTLLNRWLEKDIPACEKCTVSNVSTRHCSVHKKCIWRIISFWVLKKQLKLFDWPSVKFIVTGEALRGCVPFRSYCCSPLMIVIDWKSFY